MVAYWSKCIKCPRAVVSREVVVCHHCETGKGIFPSKVKVLVDQDVYAIGDGNAAVNDVIVFEYGGRAITYGEILDVTVANEVTRFRLKNGDTITVNGNYVVYDRFIVPCLVSRHP